MNYRRGFQRLYVVLAVLWIVIACFAYRWTPLEADWFTRNAPKSEGDPYAKYGGAVTLSEDSRMRYAKGISIAIVPPTFGYLVLFQVVPWVWRGFRLTASSSTAP
jgi:hypothetical protein